VPAKPWISKQPLAPPGSQNGSIKGIDIAEQSLSSRSISVKTVA
jgi:hypothetical protein